MKDFESLIDLIYEATSDLGQWSTALQGISDRLGGCGFVMSILPANAPLKFITGTRVDPEHLLLVKRHFASSGSNPFVAAMPHLPTAVSVAREAILDDADYFGGELYNQAFRPSCTER